MNHSKRKSSPLLIELVETHKIALSLKRLRRRLNNSEAWKRAVYHAIRMTYSGSFGQAAAIRAILELP